MRIELNLDRLEKYYQDEIFRTSVPIFSKELRDLFRHGPKESTEETDEPVDDIDETDETMDEIEETDEGYTEHVSSHTFETGRPGPAFDHSVEDILLMEVGIDIESGKVVQDYYLDRRGNFYTADMPGDYRILRRRFVGDYCLSFDKMKQVMGEEFENYNKYIGNWVCFPLRCYQTYVGTDCKTKRPTLYVSLCRSGLDPKEFPDRFYTHHSNAFQLWKWENGWTQSLSYGQMYISADAFAPNLNGERFDALSLEQKNRFLNYKQWVYLQIISMFTHDYIGKVSVPCTIATNTNAYGDKEVPPIEWSPYNMDETFLTPDGTCRVKLFGLRDLYLDWDLYAWGLTVDDKISYTIDCGFPERYPEWMIHPNAPLPKYTSLYDLDVSTNYGFLPYLKSGKNQKLSFIGSTTNFTLEQLKRPQRVVFGRDGMLSMNVVPDTEPLWMRYTYLSNEPLACY